MTITTGAYRNSTDLITEALANLGVLVAGQVADVEDFNYVSEKLDSIMRMLAGMEICLVADTDNIPGEWFAPLADIVASECATKFGAAGQDLIDLQIKGLGAPPPAGTGPGSGMAAVVLRTINRNRPTYQPQPLLFL